MSLALCLCGCVCRGGVGGHCPSLSCPLACPNASPRCCKNNPRAPLHTYTKDTAARAGLDAEAAALLLVSNPSLAVVGRACGRGLVMILDHASPPIALAILNTARASCCCCCCCMPKHKQIPMSSWACCGAALLSCTPASARPSGGRNISISKSIIGLGHTNTHALSDPSFLSAQVIPSPTPLLNHVRTSVDELQCGPGEEPPPDQGHDLPHGLHPR